MVTICLHLLFFREGLREATNYADATESQDISICWIITVLYLSEDSLPSITECKWTLLSSFDIWKIETLERCTDLLKSTQLLRGRGGIWTLALELEPKMFSLHPFLSLSNIRCLYLGLSIVAPAQIMRLQRRKGPFGWLKGKIIEDFHHDHWLCKPWVPTFSS